tara:strand:- start:586 stop:1761 length:1176 start_codon:yes stop_codon:yes gene_type:complete
MIKIEKEIFVARIINGYTKFNSQSGVLPIEPNMVTEFKLDKKFVYKLNAKNSDVESLIKVHERLISEFLSKIPLNCAATAYVQKKSYLDFLEPHRNNYHFIRVDLKNFFHSISKTLISETFKEYFESTFLDENKKQNLLNSFINLVTYQVPDTSKNTTFAAKTILPMGFKTSPIISNIVFRKIDIIIEDYCSMNNIVYSRYADDLLFSSKTNSETIENPFSVIFGNEKINKLSFIHSDRFINEISIIVKISKFKLNIKKTIKGTSVISLNGYTIDGSNYSDKQGCIRISNKKTHIICKLIHELQQNRSPEVIMNKLYSFKVSEKYFSYRPVKNEHVERYCRDQLLNKLVGYRSYLISILKYNERYNCIDNDSIEKYQGIIENIESLALSIG